MLTAGPGADPGQPGQNVDCWAAKATLTLAAGESAGTSGLQPGAGARLLRLTRADDRGGQGSRRADRQDAYWQPHVTLASSMADGLTSQAQPRSGRLRYALVRIERRGQRRWRTAGGGRMNNASGTASAPARPIGETHWNGRSSPPVCHLPESPATVPQTFETQAEGKRFLLPPGMPLICSVRLRVAGWRRAQKHQHGEKRMNRLDPKFRIGGRSPHASMLPWRNHENQYGHRGERDVSASPASLVR